MGEEPIENSRALELIDELVDWSDSHDGPPVRPCIYDPYQQCYPIKGVCDCMRAPSEW
jgi:hypothetical protein